MSVSFSDRIAVLIPCYNEAVAIGQVVHDFRASLPDATVYVFDNASTDNTSEVAREAGAVVRFVDRPGKGNVVRRMFADVEADVYVLVDGDDTYDATSAPRLVAALLEGGLDMVVGTRRDTEEAAYRSGHRLGNRVLTGFVARIFGRAFTDMLSGYRVFSRRFVKSFPALSAGFETETELTVHALELRMPIAEVETPYKARPEGSTSKLNTYRDGFRILLTIAKLFRAERPLEFFGLLAIVLAVLAVALAIPLFVTYLDTGLVPRIPTAVLVTGLVILSAFSVMSGLILSTVTRGRREFKRLFYLSIPGPRGRA